MTQEYTQYANFNSVTVKGRVFHADIKGSGENEFLVLSLISTLTTDGQSVNFDCTDSNYLMKAFNAGKLPVGREITLTGHISGTEFSYLNKQTGEVKLLSRPRIKLSSVQILEGGYGVMPKSKDAGYTEYDEPSSNSIRRTKASSFSPAKKADAVSTVKETVVSALPSLY